MIQYTTPTMVLTIPANLSGSDVYVTIKQRNTTVTKKLTTSDVVASTDSSVATVTLSQEESGKFDTGRDASIQVNWITADGKRYATKHKPINIGVNLIPEVKTYG